MARKAPRQTRAQRQQALHRAAAEISLPPHVDVCVVGGGAAGLVAAITAAEEGARVLVIERDAECGRTILATGNGRCNFANACLHPSRYNDPHFVRAVVGTSWLDDILRFFSGHGLAWVREDERLYPLSRQAASVRNVLLEAVRAAGVTLGTAREMMAIQPRDEGLIVTLRDQFYDQRTHTLTASRVIIATGGGTADAWGELGLTSVCPQPLLCPLACKGPALSSLDGRRAHAIVTLARNGNELMREEGEVLFRPYGLSGIVVFNASRHAKPGDEIALDLLPRLSTKDAHALARHTLDGLLDPAIARILEGKAGSVEASVTLAKDLRYRVVGTTETSRAQVTRGGLANEQFKPATLESLRVPALYACGEALDVDGPCGGYNLAWAWKSGMVAGSHAACPAKP